MTAKITLHNKLIEIQSTLVAPKNLRNDYGGYNYRSCEGVLEAIKPLLKEHGLVLTLSDEMVSIGEYAYVQATATLSDGSEIIQVSACARDAITKTKSDAAQLTGASSSYARKYALNGLFAIDDTKDADSTNDHGKRPAKSHIKNDDKPHYSEDVTNALDPEQVANTVINYFGDKQSARDFITDAGFPIPSECNPGELRGILDALKAYEKKVAKGD